MDIPLPPGAQVIEPTEAIRRIQERDHHVPSDQAGTFLTERA